MIANAREFITLKVTKYIIANVRKFVTLKSDKIYYSQREAGTIMACEALQLCIATVRRSFCDRC